MACTGESESGGLAMDTVLRRHSVTAGVRLCTKLVTSDAKNATYYFLNAALFFGFFIPHCGSRA